MEKEAEQRRRLEEKEGQVGEKLYSVVETARLLNVSVSTVRAWLLRSSVEKRVISTDRTRVYVAYSDILMLAKEHRVADVRINQEVKGLYSVEDMTLLFGVTADTVKSWIKESDVKKQLIETKCPYCRMSKRRVYVSSDDVHLIAEQYRPEMSDVDIAAYIGEVRRNLAKIKRLKYD